MSNPWEQNNPWGKGSENWNRWMAPDGMDGAVAKAKSEKEKVFEIDGIAIIIAYPDQNPAIPQDGSATSTIATWIEEVFGDGDGAFNVGHAGIVIVNCQNGDSRYFDYGRYDRQDIKRPRKKGNNSDIVEGAVRSSTVSGFSSLGVPNWNFKKDVFWNTANILYDVSTCALLATYGKVLGAVLDGLDYQAMISFAESKQAQGYTRFGCPLNDYCASFVRDVGDKGGYNWGVSTFTGAENVSDAASHSTHPYLYSIHPNNKTLIFAESMFDTRFFQKKGGEVMELKREKSRQ
jgi:hypothetical protein